MTKARKERMMDDIIKKFGYEDNRTIAFCGMCENPEVSDFSIKEVYEDFMSLQRESQVYGNKERSLSLFL